MAKAFIILLVCFVYFCASLKVPDVWKASGHAREDSMLKVTFAIKHSDKELLHELFEDIALPSGKNYRNFLTLEELGALVGPEESTVEMINSYLETINAKKISWTPGKEFVKFFISVADASNYFKTNFLRYRHATSNRILVRADSNIFLPPIIARHVEVTTGLQDFFDTRAERKGVKNTHTATSATNAPYVLMVMGSDAQAIVYFYAICDDGSTTTNATSPCGEKGNSIERFNIRVHPEGYEAVTLALTPSEAKCSLVDSQTICHAGVNIAPYTRCNITTHSIFTNGLKSQSYNYPTKYAPTPYITPQLVFETYNIPIGTRGVNPRNSQAIVSFEEQYYSHHDLERFFDAMGILRANPVLVGYNNDSMPGGEATLDVQWVMGIGQGVNTTTWSFPQGDYILNWAEAVASTNDAPLVTSISYGDTEIGYEQKSGYGLQYIYRMNEELLKMTLRGLTVIAGSGDAGWSNVGEAGNDLSAPDPSCVPGRAFYPSVSPYVMSLSATFLSKNYLTGCGEHITPVPGKSSISVPIQCTGRVSEVPVSVSGGISWTTGGGFSNITTRFAYQESQVNYFLETSQHLPPTNYFNPNGQGYADISTIGWNQLVVWDGVFFPIGGTSASGPVAAGIFALINDELLNAGKKPLGFINPSLYQWSREYPDAFNDVTTGKNNDGDIQVPGSSYPTFCEYGFTAQAGWDPVTGLGTPNYARLKQLALTKL